MPILECDSCGYTFVYAGKSLAIPCPNECGKWRGEAPTLHVDRNVIELNGHTITIDGRHSGTQRNDEASRRFEQSVAFYTEG